MGHSLGPIYLRIGSSGGVMVFRAISGIAGCNSGVVEQA
jgi:hypothetical protein